MKISFVALFLCVFIIGMSNEHVRGDLITFTPSQDNSVFAENNNSAGAKGFAFVGVTNGVAGTTIRRAFMQFNVAGIPSGSVINSVTLNLERAFSGPSAGNDILQLHPVLQSWGEGTSTGGGQGGTGYAPSANSLTWNHRFFSSQFWTTPGGDIGPTSGTLTLDGNASFVVPSQAGMVADVQNWVNNASSNFGWALRYRDENTPGTARQFYSREATNANVRPTLTVDYTAIPEPSSCLLLATTIS